MKRREVIKTSFLALGAFAGANLGGCKSDKMLTNCEYADCAKTKKMNEKAEIKENLISPEQTAKYSITAPLPFDFTLIDEMKELNLKLKKSQVKTLYNSLPFPLAKNLETFHSRRGINKQIKNIDDFIKYAEYAKDGGFDFVYTLNSPKPFSDFDFKKHKEELFYLLDKLNEANINKFKISNTQLLNILTEKYPHFELQASTSFEYHNVNQYINLLKNYPNIKLLDIAIDENRNFEFLQNLKRIFPDTELEIMVNEPCLRGCPARISHCATTFCEFDCAKIINKNWVEEFCKSGVVYPWNLKYYSAININRFKLICAGFVRADIKNINYLKDYLEMVENGTDNYSVKDFFEKIIKFSPDAKTIKTVKLNEVIKYFPDINYFVKNGDSCAAKCTTGCNYCIDCARKIKKIII